MSGDTPDQPSPGADSGDQDNQAVSRCLDHWKAAVRWLNDEKPEAKADFYPSLRTALVSQSDIWLSLLTGRQCSRRSRSRAMPYITKTIGSIEASASESFRAAYQQIRIELAAFSFGVGVSYPLVECFVLSSDPVLTDIQNAYTFADQVPWTQEERREEVEDVLRAALGPINLLSGARVHHDSGAGA